MQSRVLYGLFTLFFLSLTCFFSRVQANDKQANGSSKVSITGTGIPLKSVFKAIKKQTGLYVMYSSTLTTLDREEKVTLNFKETPLDEVLRFVFKGKDLEWSYNDIVILVNKKKPTSEIASVMEGDSSITKIPAVTGRVIDANGNPVIGATVMVKGTAQGASTDAEGNFTLSNVTKNATLRISSIGYDTREVTVKGKSILTQLNVDVNKLDETVIIAYGTTTKRFNTGNVSTVKGEDIQRQPVSNPLAALQGRVPGMVITQQTGVPGGGFAVQIRGRNSVNLNVGNDPLYIVDGVPYPSKILPTNGRPIIGTGSPLNYINPSDIESIDVLKDADATAIYGSRGANGVVLITTKKGQAGKTTVNVNLYSGIGQVTRKIDYLNTPQYLEMRREAFKNDGQTPETWNAPDLLSWDTTRYTDWQKLLIGGKAHYTDMQASVSGGNTLTQYLIGASYHKETTVFPGNFSDRKGNVHFNVTNSSANQRFRILLDGSYLIDRNNLLSQDLTSYINLPPDAPPVYNEDGSLNWANSTWPNLVIGNPLSATFRKFVRNTNNLIGNAVVSYRILPDLEIRTSFGYNNMQDDELQTFPLGALNPAFAQYNTPSSSFTNNNSSSWIIEPQVTYKWRLGKGRANVLMGTTFQQSNSKGQILNATGFASDALLENIQAAPNVSTQSVTNTVYKYNALFGRLNYNWEDKYLINLTARRDGSSRFGPGRQFANFGAVGIGWIFSKESFMEPASSFLSFGKLRVSYGTSGNDQIGDYQYLSTYRSVQYPYLGVQGLYPNNLFNNNFAWELNKKLEGGVELGFLKDRFLITASYYRNRSSNQLVGYDLPIITGFTSVTANLPAEVQNTGIEFTLITTNLQTKGFKWTTSANLTIPRNKLIAFPNLENTGYANSYIIGQPLTTTKVYHLIGVDAETGAYKFADNSGKPVDNPSYEKDRIALVNTDPKFYGGLQNNFQYKGFQLDVIFQFVKQTGVNYLFDALPGSSLGNEPITVLDRWQKNGDNKSIQRFNQDYNLYNAAEKALQSDRAYSDASFIRLKNLSFSYRFPESWNQKIHLQNFQLYMQCQNLLTITNYKGMDPENQGGAVTLPPLRVLTLGIRGSF